MAKRQGRTLEEVLAGVPAFRKQRANENTSDETIVHEDGRKTAYRYRKNPNAPAKNMTGRALENLRKSNWFKRVDPNHPEYDPELALKHFHMIRANAAKATAAKRGMPRGWRNREWRPYFEGRLELAKQLVDAMIDNGILGFDESAKNRDMDTDEGKATAALDYAAAVVITPDVPLKTRLSHARLVLEFTKTKPATKQQVELATAEDFLAALAAEKGV